MSINFYTAEDRKRDNERWDEYRREWQPELRPTEDPRIIHCLETLFKENSNSPREIITAARRELCIHVYIRAQGNWNLHLLWNQYCKRTGRPGLALESMDDVNSLTIRDVDSIIAYVLSCDEEDLYDPTLYSLLDPERYDTLDGFRKSLCDAAEYTGLSIKIDD